MVQIKKIPVTVDPQLKTRVEMLVTAVQKEISEPARTAVTNSRICCLAIEDMLGRYEKNPKDLATRLGFTHSAVV